MLDQFPNLTRRVSVTVFAAGSHVDGEWVEGSESSVEDDMIAIPITPAQLRSLPEGRYTAGDMRFYRQGPAAYKSGDIISVDGTAYTIRDLSDRSFDGNFTIYFARREYDQS